MKSNVLTTLGIAAMLTTALAACGRQESDRADSAAPPHTMPDKESMPEMQMSAEPTPPNSSDAAASATAQTHTTQGTIQSIDHNASTIRIAHEAVPSAKWPAMTMDFKVQSHDVLAGLKEGERVRFSFTEQTGGHYMIVEISPQG